jgi:hypothetical protein
MSARGFTLVELLISTVVTLLVTGAALTMASSARASFDAGPGALDTTRRLREAVEFGAATLYAAGGDLGSATLAASVPLVRPLTDLDGSTDGQQFQALWILRAIDHVAARLAVAQPGPADSLTLDSAPPCPVTPGICGLDVDDVAVVFDSRGRFDIFEVGAVVPGLMRVTPATPLSRVYAAGASVLKVRADRLGLVRQPDGSNVLSRVTWAGAREPIVDGVVDLELRVWGEGAPAVLRDGEDGSGLASFGLPPPSPAEPDPDEFWPPGEHCMSRRDEGLPVSRLAQLGETGALVELLPAHLDDGPWCERDGSATAFDADLFRVRRVDLRIRVEASSAMLRGPAGRLFSRAGASATTPLRWVPDREIALSVAIPRR